MLQHLEAPAHAFGMALIHPRQIAREERRLFAAGAGADFQDGGAGVGGILGQKGDAQRLLHPGDAGPEARQLVFGQRAHLGIGEHRLGLGQIVQRAAVGGNLVGDRFQRGIFTADPGDLGGGRTFVQLRLEKLEALGDLGEFFQRNHGRGVADGRGPVKGAKRGTPARRQKRGVSHPPHPPWDI